MVNGQLYIDLVIVIVNVIVQTLSVFFVIVIVNVIVATYSCSFMSKNIFCVQGMFCEIHYLSSKKLSFLSNGRKNENFYVSLQYLIFMNKEFVNSAEICIKIKKTTRYAEEQECHDTLPDTRRVSHLVSYLYRIFAKKHTRGYV